MLNLERSLDISLLFECVERSKHEIESEMQIYFHLFSLIIHFVAVTNKLEF